MEQINQVVAWVRREARELMTVKWTFLTACLLIVAAIWFVFELRYGDRIESVRASNEVLRDRISALEASGDAAKGASPLYRRTLSQEQITALRKALFLGADEKIKLRINAEGACPDCASYHNELVFALTGLRNLELDSTGTMFGPPNTHPSGLLIVGQGFSDPASFVSRLSDALTKANIDHGRLDAPPEFRGATARLDVLAARKY